MVAKVARKATRGQGQIVIAVSNPRAPPIKQAAYLAELPIQEYIWQAIISVSKDQVLVERAVSQRQLVHLLSAQPLKFTIELRCINHSLCEILTSPFKLLIPAPIKGTSADIHMMDHMQALRQQPDDLLGSQHRGVLLADYQYVDLSDGKRTGLLPEVRQRRRAVGGQSKGDPSRQR